MKSVRTLVVEDDGDAREMLVEWVGALGHSAQSAANAKEALAMLTGTPFELILIDVGLPEIDGLELGRRIRAGVGPTVHLVALTGYTDDATRQEAHASGFDDFLVKPIQNDALMTLMARVRN